MPRCAKDSRVVFDLGMNNGDDTAFYLSRGFNVIALDANPILCKRATKRFQAAIQNGHLKIVNAAIWEERGETTFYINLDNDHWSSLDIGWAGRNSSRCEKISVQCVTLSSLFAEFSVPRFLKIDVEGADYVVLEQLRGNNVLPQYVSVEDCRFGLQYLEALASCGYNRFKLLDQSAVGHMIDAATGRFFPAGSSGPFGEDVPGEWLLYNQIVALYSSAVRDLQGNRIAPPTQWWDIHSQLLETPE